MIMTMTTIMKDAHASDDDHGDDDDDDDAHFQLLSVSDKVFVTRLGFPISLK